jgi:CBS domain-containing protein
MTRHREPSVTLPYAGETAGQLMTAPVITIRAETPLNEALRLMLRHQIKRLPVVDAEGHLLGLLGRNSLLNGLLAASAPAATPLTDPALHSAPE